jgi:hypothetical protein
MYNTISLDVVAVAVAFASPSVNIPTLKWMGALHCTTQEISETDE